MATFPRYRDEYRICKKGCECYRTEVREDALENFRRLSAKRPGVYTLQRRDCRVNRFGVLEIAWNGQNAWSPWFDFTIKEAGA